MQTDTLPPHQVRVHPRAKRWKLRILPNGEVLVTIPKRFALRRVPDILRERRDWIEHNLTHYPRARIELPTELSLRAVGECWSITHNTEAAEQPRLAKTGPNELTAFGVAPAVGAEQLRALFHQWLRSRARHHFMPWLANLAQRHGLSFEGLSIRGQRARWGSCSPDKNITLNYKLLFMPPALAEHVMLHELAHTIHLDHSTDFWHLLCRLDAEFEQSRASMRQAHRFLPAFLNE